MKSLVVIFLISSVASAALWAQSTSSGQISGTVQDTAGGLIPGAQVSVTQTATGATRTTQSGEDGNQLHSDSSHAGRRLHDHHVACLQRESSDTAEGTFREQQDLAHTVQPSGIEDVNVRIRDD